MNDTHSHITGEVLPPALSKGEARGLETQAKRHWRTASRNAIQFAAELRRLQDGQAHIVRGFDSFGTYAEHTFDGLASATAKQLSRQGGVLLTLERHGRISLEGLGRDLPGTTALRALSGIHGTHGERAMLAVYDRAVKLRPGRAIAEATVKQADRELYAPVIAELPPGELGPEDDQDDDEDGASVEEDMTPEDRLAELRQLRVDLDELIATPRAPGPPLTPEVRRDTLDEIATMQRRLRALAERTAETV